MSNRPQFTSASRRIELACQRVLKAIGLGGLLIASPVLGQTVTSQWQSTTGGSWIDPTNWSNGIPNGTSSAAVFGSIIGTPSTITLDGSQTVAALTFNNSANAYTLAPGNGGALNLQSTGTSSATLTDQAGSQFITAPLTLNSPTQATVVNPGDTLSVSNATIAGGLTFSGAGTLALAATTISSPSTVTVSSNIIGSGSLNLGNLTLNAPVEFNGPVSGTISAIQVNTTGQNFNPAQGYATYGLDDFAAIDRNGAPGQVLPGSAIQGAGGGFYTPLTYEVDGLFPITQLPTLANLDVSLTGPARINQSYVAQTIRFNVVNGGLANIAGNYMDQLLLPQMNATVSTTGILITPNVGSTDVLITPNLSGNNQGTQFLTAGNDGTSPNMVIWQNNINNHLILNTGIEDGAAGPVSLTEEGPGTMTILATSTYTGGTNIDAGTIQIPYNAALGNPAGPINLNGGQLIAEQTLTLDSGGASPIARSVNIGPNGGNLAVAAGRTLTVDGPLSGSGTLSIGTGSFQLDMLQSSTSNTVTTGLGTAGVGTVALAGDTSNFSGGIVVQDGTLQFAPGSGTHAVSSLTIYPDAEVDLTQNTTLLINYGSPANDPVSAIRTDLNNAYAPYNAGKEYIGGNLYTSATSTSGPLLVGYADGDIDTGTPAAANQLLLMTTLAGDANLDGAVNFSDLLTVAQDFGRTGQDWEEGDFNYDGIVNFADLLLVAQNFGKSLDPEALDGQLSAGQLAQLPVSFAAEWQLADAEVQAARSASVPEPTMLGLLIVGAAGLLARRRRTAPSRV